MSEERSACQAMEGQLAAYALGEPPDRSLLDHLAGCESCRRELESFTRTARVLPYGAPDVAPPPDLRERILDAAGATGGVTQRAPVSRAAPRWSWGWLRWGVAFATIVALLLWNLLLQRQLDARNAQLAVSRENWQVVTRLLNDPEVRSVALRGDVASGTLWTVPDESLGCLMIENLPDPSAGHVYQIWLVRDGAPVSAGTFVPQGRESWTVVRADEPPASYESLGITIEPRGGSLTPTGPRVLQGSIVTSAAILSSPVAASAP